MREKQFKRCHNIISIALINGITKVTAPSKTNIGMIVGVKMPSLLRYVCATRQNGLSIKKKIERKLIINPKEDKAKRHNAMSNAEPHFR